MRCCVNCFISDYTKAVVQSFSTVKGICDFCATEDAHLCDPRELVSCFRNIVELYLPVSKTNESEYGLAILSNAVGSLESRVLINFKSLIFRVEHPEAVRALLSAIFIECGEYQLLFSEDVIPEHIFDNGRFADYHRLASAWDNFVAEIKTKNRFHISSQIDLGLIEKILQNHVKSYRIGKIFYRGRISDGNGFVKAHMGNPPASLAKAGRANPAGISYLYIAESVDTTLYETRAGLYDYVAIGEFTVRKAISVINLREPHLYDPVQLADNDKLKDFMLNLPFLSILEKELSKPLRRSDNELDYLPTQYLSEFIKSLGYDGIEYRSSLNPRGYNLAVFHPNSLECTKAYVHEINRVEFYHNKIVD